METRNYSITREKMTDYQFASQVKLSLLCVIVGLFTLLPYNDHFLISVISA